MMQIGRFRDRVTIRSRTIVNDGGAAVATPVTRAARVQASVESPTGERVERIFGSQVQPVATHLVTVWARTDVRLSDQVIWHQTPTIDRTLEIKGMQAVGPMRRHLVLACEERDVAR